MRHHGNRDWRSALLLAVATAALPAGLPAATATPDHVTQRLEAGGATRTVTLPAGYRLELLTPALRRPRMLTFLPGGELLVGSRDGVVYRLAPPYDAPEVLLRTGGYPHSVAWRDGVLFVAFTDGIHRLDYRPGDPRPPGGALRPWLKLPGGPGHSSRTLRVGPDGRLYVSLGISGNCSDQYLADGVPFDRWRGGVAVLDESGPTPRWRSYASGLRNPVGFDWQPGSGTLYVTNNGPDHHGFERPREHFSRAPEGSFHGMPWFVVDGERVARDGCIGSAPPRPASDVTLPAATFPARNAPLGMAFAPANAFDPRLAGDAVVALHGSWAVPAGGGDGDRRPPALAVVRFDGMRAVRVDTLVDGFQDQSGGRWLRPAGVAFGPDGALYFSSDQGVDGIFRLQRDPAAP